MNSVTRSQHLRLTATEEEREIYVYSVVVQSSAVDEENVPQDIQVLTAYFKESPFDFEVNEWALPWIECGYRVVDKWLVLHSQFDADRNVFKTVWESPTEI
jgi:hypothetical protein